MMPPANKRNTAAARASIRIVARGIPKPLWATVAKRVAAIMARPKAIMGTRYRGMASGYSLFVLATRLGQKQSGFSEESHRRSGMGEGFEILANGIPRTFRDMESMALDAGRILKDRDRSSEITVIKRGTRQWLIIADPFAKPGPW